jgi:hypothetical protein
MVQIAATQETLDHTCWLTDSDHHSPIGMLAPIAGDQNTIHSKGKGDGPAVPSIGGFACNQLMWGDRL